MSNFPNGDHNFQGSLVWKATQNDQCENNCGIPAKSSVITVCCYTFICATFTFHLNLELKSVQFDYLCLRCGEGKAKTVFCEYSEKAEVSSKFNKRQTSMLKWTLLKREKP